jgi:hypothetical protein
MRNRRFIIASTSVACAQSHYRRDLLLPLDLELDPLELELDPLERELDPLERELDPLEREDPEDPLLLGGL